MKPSDDTVDALPNPPVNKTDDVSKMKLTREADKCDRALGVAERKRASVYIF